MECPHLAVSVKIQNNLRKESTDVTKEWHCAGKCRPKGKVFFVHSEIFFLNLAMHFLASEWFFFISSEIRRSNWR
jgi:hypothetical protein